VNANEIKKESALEGYDAFVFGSPTYHGQMIQGMKTLLFLAEKANLEGKAGGSFGAFGWSGEAPDRIYDTMKNIFKMDMVGGFEDFRNLKAFTCKCPNCGKEKEIFSDEFDKKHVCSGCGKEIDFSKCTLEGAGGA